jgi:hypothetical protein
MADFHPLTRTVTESHTKETILVICDQTGHLQSASASLGALPVTSLGTSISSSGLGGIAAATLCADAGQKHFAELFGAGSAITHWLSEQLERAWENDELHSESRLAVGEKTVRVRFEPLRGGGAVTGFAVHIAEEEPTPAEGSILVTREQWHEIKNQLGGLKLYATFLRKKLPEGEDRDIIGKVLNGLNGLIEDLARIRRGERR